MSFIDKYNINPEIYLNALERFIDPKGMNINAMGIKTLGKLINMGLVKHPVDLYTLDFIDLARKSVLVGYYASRIQIAIDLDHTVNLCNVLYALNIPKCGIDTCRELAAHYKTLRNFKANALEQDDLILTEDIKDSLADWVNKDYNIEFLDILVRRNVGATEYVDPLLNKPLSSQLWYVSVHNKPTLSLRKRLVELGARISTTLTAKCHTAVLVDNEPELHSKCYRIAVSSCDLTEAYRRVKEYEDFLPKNNCVWS